MSAFDVTDDVESSYLTEQFLAFQAELVRVKRALSAPPAAAGRGGPEAAPPADAAASTSASASASAPAASPPDAAAASPGADAGAPSGRRAADAAANARRPHQVGHGLRGFLEGQDAQAEGLGGRYARENNDEARYLKAALADEALITLAEWEYSGRWVNHLLEQELFHSRRAGDRVFDAIDTLLRERVPARREMAMLYLYALAMGFEGRYRDAPDGAEKLRQRRLELYRYATGHLPDPVFTDAQPGRGLDLGRRLLPQPYQYTLDQGAPQLLPNPRRWIRGFLLSAAILLGCSWYIWDSETGELSGHLDGRYQPQDVGPDSCAVAMRRISCAPPKVAQ